MDLAALRDGVGAERFDAATAWSWRTAKGCGSTGASGEWPEDLAMVPHEMDEYWWDASLSSTHKLDLALEVYRAMPCYWNAALIYSYRDHLDDADHPALWSAIRGVMDDPDDRLADPMGYSLWCEWFEDRDTRETAWRQLCDGEPPEQRLRRLLPLSGPVPYLLKRDLYWRLVNDGHRWDRLIGAALVASTFDVYGHIDGRDALRLCDRLTGLEHVPGSAQMLQRLEGRAPRRWWSRRRRST